VLYISNHPLLVKRLVMAEISGETASGRLNIVSPPENEIDQFFAVAHVEDITMLREQYRCPHFHILVIGRANAGKTTILEKVCGVAKGTKPIIIHDKKGKLG
jgi:ABC-type uncharacterized transport system ATPase subunit